MVDNISKERVFVPEEVMWRSKFACYAVFHHQNLIRVHDCVDTVRDCQNSAASKGFSQGTLNLAVGLEIYARRCLIFRFV